MSETPTTATHASGPGAGYPLVAGRCPACGGASLFLGAGGHVTCARLDCREPTAADDVLHGGPPAWLDRPRRPMHRFRRREWAAAYRDARERLARLAEPIAAPQLSDIADLIESGALTPWADQPEPATQPDLPARLAEVGEGLCREPTGDDREWGICGRERPCPEHDQPGGGVTPERAELDLDVIQARADAATAGPWRAGSKGWRLAAGLGEVYVEQPEEVGGHLIGDLYGDCGAHPDNRRADAEFIAHARQDVPALVAEVRRLRGLVPDPQADLAPEADAQSEPAAGLGPGILGRALLHQTVDGHPQLWVERDGLWHTHTASVPRTRSYVESAERYVGPVREVLLVSPAAGRVLDAVGPLVKASRKWVHNQRVLDSLARAGQWLDAERALIAAVDALDGDQPAPTELLRTPAACGALAPADDPDDHECDLGACHSGPHECAGCGATWRDADALDGDQPAQPTTAHLGDVRYASLGEVLDRARRERVAGEHDYDQPAEPAPPGTTLTVPDSPKMLRETLCVAQTAIGQSGVDVARMRQHVDLLGRLIAECDRHRPLGPDGKHGDRHTATCGCDRVDAAEPAPEPDSGPVWSRESIAELIRQLRNTGLSTHQFHADQTEALLADRDRLAADLDGARGWLELRDSELISANAQRDAARAELAEVTAQRDNLKIQVHNYLRLLDAIAEAAPGVTNPVLAIDRLRQEASAHEGELGDLRAKLSAADAEVDRLRELTADSIDPATIPDQQARGWPDWHPEAYCHRCGRPNVSWYADSAIWNEVHGGSGPIWCPVCFARAYEQQTGRYVSWRVAPRDLPDEAAHLVASEAAMRHQLAEAARSASDSAAYAEQGWAEVERLRGLVDQLPDRVEAAHRHGAADALDAACEWLDPSQPGSGPVTPDYLARAAAEIRSGTRPVPGSPQPASGGGGDDEQG